MMQIEKEARESTLKSIEVYILNDNIDDLQTRRLVRYYMLIPLLKSSIHIPII